VPKALCRIDAVSELAFQIRMIVLSSLVFAWIARVPVVSLDAVIGKEFLLFLRWILPKKFIKKQFQISLPVVQGIAGAVF
jgi:hypothetical protein